MRKRCCIADFPLLQAFNFDIFGAMNVIIFRVNITKALPLFAMLVLLVLYFI